MANKQYHNNNHNVTSSSVVSYKRNKRSHIKEEEQPEGAATSTPPQPTSATATMSRATYSAGVYGTLKRIRTPHPHDVLSGRGGGINSHEGNVQFRAWVAERKNDYNLAPNKAEKARVAREVIQLVQNQEPSGRFLTKDLTSVGGPGWWIELDDDKIMAKTSQALREGAPQIRAAHKDELQEIRAHSKKSSPSHRRPRKHSPERKTVGYVEPEPVNEPTVRIKVESPTCEEPNLVEELRENLQHAAREASEAEQREDDEFVRPEKRLRVENNSNNNNSNNGQTVNPFEETPPLMPQPASCPDIVPLDHTLMPEPAVMKSNGGLTRSHSLALSDLSFGDWNHEEFVNPFENEKEHLDSLRDPTCSPVTPRPAVLRESSITSVGSFGSLLRPMDLPRLNSSSSDMPRFSSNSSDSTGVRSSNTCNTMLSSRSLGSTLSDLTDAVTSRSVAMDFTEGMKSIYNALHPDLDDPMIPTHMFPFRDGNSGRESPWLIED